MKISNLLVLKFYYISRVVFFFFYENYFIINICKIVNTKKLHIILIESHFIAKADTPH